VDVWSGTVEDELDLSQHVVDLGVASSHGNRSLLLESSLESSGDGWLFAATMGGVLLRLQAFPRLRLDWQHSTGGFIDFQSAPTYVPEHGMVLVGGYSQVMIAINASTGVDLWRSKAADVVAQATFVPTMNAVLFGSSDQHVYAVDAGSGHLLWQHRFGFAVQSAPVVRMEQGGSLTIAVSGTSPRAGTGLRVLGLNKSGQQLWTVDTKAMVYAPVVWARDECSLFVTGLDKFVRRVNVCSHHQVHDEL